MSASTPHLWTWPRPLTLSSMISCGGSFASLAALTVSLPLPGSYMIACSPECKMMVKPYSHSQWQMVLCMCCVMASTLFSMMFPAMLTDAFHDSDIGIVLRYWCEWKIFNLQRTQVITKLQTDIIHDFPFADNCVLNASTQPKMQENLELLSAACKDYDLTISTKKTEVMDQTAPTVFYKKPTVTVDGEKLAVGR